LRHPDLIGDGFHDFFLGHDSVLPREASPVSRLTPGRQLRRASTVMVTGT
jgi:hypothetical protein